MNLTFIKNTIAAAGSTINNYTSTTTTTGNGKRRRIDDPASTSASNHGDILAVPFDLDRPHPSPYLAMLAVTPKRRLEELSVVPDFDFDLDFDFDFDSDSVSDSEAIESSAASAINLGVGEVLAVKRRRVHFDFHVRFDLPQEKDQGMPPHAPYKLASRSGTQLTQKARQDTLSSIAKFLFEELPVAGTKRRFEELLVVGSDPEAMPPKKPRPAPPSTIPSKRPARHSKKQARLANASKSPLFAKCKPPSMTPILEDVASCPWNMVEGADYPVVEDEESEAAEAEFEDVAVPMDVEFEVATDQVVIKHVTFDETKNSVRIIWNAEQVSQVALEHETAAVVESVPKLPIKKRDNLVSTLDGGYWAVPATGRKRRQTNFFTP